MQRRNFETIEVIQFMTHFDLRLYKAKGSKAAIQKRAAYEKSLTNTYRKGNVFVSPSKDALMQGVGHVVTSYETLDAQKNILTHWTPNIYTHGSYIDFKNRIIQGHTNDNLKQVNVIGFDIDTKDVDLYAIFVGCDEAGLPRPNVLLETPNGYQGFFVLETPFFANRQTEFKAIRTAEKVSHNIREALKRYVPIDFACTPFGFYRIPNDSNILYFDDVPANTSQLIAWSIKHEKSHNRGLQLLFSHNPSLQAAPIHSEWYAALLNAVSINQGHFCSGRNNSLFTLALANYASGIPYEEAFDTLDQFNSNLHQSLKRREFERTLKSAYSGRYAAPKRVYVEGLLEQWTNEEVSFKGTSNVFRKFKKEREERSRSHYGEWEEDLFRYLELHTTPEEPFLQCSLRELAKKTGIPFSSLKETLKRSTGKVMKRTTGERATAKTYIATNRMLFRHVLYLRRTQLKDEQLSFIQLLPKRTLQKADIPSLEELFLQYQHLIEPHSGTSPPLRQSG